MQKRANFFYHLHFPKISAREARFKYTFGWGGLTLLFLLVLGIIDALELLYYVPSEEEANLSLQFINLFVPFGDLIRSIHFWAVQTMVITCILHLLRVAFTGAYKPPRRFNWLIGLLLLVFILLFDFTGYDLRWDREIAWASMVGTNLIKSIPAIGAGLYDLIVGAVEIGPSTILRFYGWHINGLPIFATIFVAWHIFRVKRDGGISNSKANAETTRHISRANLIRREVLTALIATIILLIVSTLCPPSLGPKANFENLSQDATAPWFFPWIQQLLRIGPPFLMGVLIPLVLLIILALLPYVMNRRFEGTSVWFNQEGRKVQWVALIIALCILSLTLKGVLQ
jgi:quinol-cytochrome oxidoreductase complex cytochrome b subunit